MEDDETMEEAAMRELTEEIPGNLFKNQGMFRADAGIRAAVDPHNPVCRVFSFWIKTGTKKQKIESPEPDKFGYWSWFYLSAMACMDPSLFVPGLQSTVLRAVELASGQMDQQIVNATWDVEVARHKMAKLSASRR